MFRGETRPPQVRLAPRRVTRSNAYPAIFPWAHLQAISCAFDRRLDAYGRARRKPAQGARCLRAAAEIYRARLVRSDELPRQRAAGCRQPHFAIRIFDVDPERQAKPGVSGTDR